MLKKIDKTYFEKLDQEIKLIPLSYDKAFKMTFKYNLDILKDFLSVVIPLNITKEDKISLLDSELPIEKKNEYQKTVDILIVINEKIFIDIEMNRSKFENVIERNIEYRNKLSNIIFEKGTSIKDLKEKYLYQLNLNAHPNEEVLDDIIVLYGLKTHKIYLSNDCIILKGLERYRDLYYNEGVKSKDVIWLTVLTASSFQELYELISQILTRKKVEKLMKGVINMSSDSFILHAWEKEKTDDLVKYNEIQEATNKGKNIGIEIGQKEGIEIGQKKKSLQIVQNMLKENADASFISKVTGLSKEEIQQIKKDM